MPTGRMAGMAKLQFSLLRLLGAVTCIAVSIGAARIYDDYQSFGVLWLSLFFVGPGIAIGLVTRRWWLGAAFSIGLVTFAILKSHPI